MGASSTDCLCGLIANKSVFKYQKGYWIGSLILLVAGWKNKLNRPKP